MNSLYDSGDDFAVNSSEAKRSRSLPITIISVAAAVTITAALLIGVLIWRKWHEEKTGIQRGTQSEQALPAAQTLPAKVQVLMDEPVRKGPQAIITGTVQNISGETLSNLMVEIELFHRRDAGTEVRSLEVVPNELAPEQSGKYSLTLSGDYRSVKLVRVKSGARPDEIGFRAAPGAKRPVERAPQTKTVIVNRPSNPSKGEEFINTPDNPARIP